MALRHPYLHKSALLTLDVVAILVGCAIAAPFALTLALPFLPSF